MTSQTASSSNSLSTSVSVTFSQDQDQNFNLKTTTSVFFKTKTKLFSHDKGNNSRARLFSQDHDNDPVSISEPEYTHILINNGDWQAAADYMRNNVKQTEAVQSVNYKKLLLHHTEASMHITSSWKHLE